MAMSFFRRRRKEKEVAPKQETLDEPAAKSPEVVPSDAPAPETAPVAEAAESAASAPAAPAPAAPVPEPLPTPVPPPLPEKVAPPADPLPIAPRPLSQCFVCGTSLEGGFCPKCRIHWVE
ncbi:MAG TPA: hypothetical protein VMF04_03990 [Thermoplasmata archaeon]|nr:hypothetical protein [Thermoplasmata archaeon]